MTYFGDPTPEDFDLSATCDQNDDHDHCDACGECVEADLLTIVTDVDAIPQTMAVCGECLP